MLLLCGVLSAGLAAQQPTFRAGTTLMNYLQSIEPGTRVGLVAPETVSIRVVVRDRNTGRYGTVDLNLR